MDTGRYEVRLSALTLQEIVDNTSDLPALPEATIRVVKASQEPAATARSVGDALAQDLALTARVLRLANSSFYGMQRRITNPQEAVVLLGMRAVRNLAMVASTYHWMSQGLDGYSLEPMEFWEHSLATAVGAQVLSLQVAPAAADVAFTCGLLHDLGKLALGVWIENRVSTIHALAASSRVPVLDAERELFGFDHQDVGAALAEKWNLPKVIVEACGYHHRPSESFPDSSVLDVVHVADFLTTHLHEGEVPSPLDQAAMARLGFDEDELPALQQLCRSAYDQYEKLFSEKAV